MALAAACAILAIPSLTMDRSCHNELRDGRNSIGPVLLFSVAIEPGDWPRLQAIAERFAADAGWSVDESNAKDKAFSPHRFVSLCTEPGTSLMIDGADLARATTASVTIYQPQGGTTWRPPTERLLTAIEAGLPGRLRRGRSGTEVQAPTMLMDVP